MTMRTASAARRELVPPNNTIDSNRVTRCAGAPARHRERYVLKRSRQYPGRRAS